MTGGYWAFTVTDGAILMLVVLYLHQLGYSPFEVAMVFLFYEIFGIVTNLVGGWLGARIGLNLTMHIGMALQVVVRGLRAGGLPAVAAVAGGARIGHLEGGRVRDGTLTHTGCGRGAAPARRIPPYTCVEAYISNHI